MLPYECETKKEGYSPPLQGISKKFIIRIFGKRIGDDNFRSRPDDVQMVHRTEASGISAYYKVFANVF